MTLASCFAILSGPILRGRRVGKRARGFMDAIGSMNSLRDDTATIVRNGKNASARRVDDQDSTIGAFDALLAGVVALPVALPIVLLPVGNETPVTTQTTTQIDGEAVATAPISAPPVDPKAAASDAAATAVEANKGSTPAGFQPDAQAGPEGTAPALANDQSVAAAALVDGETLLAQLSALGVDGDTAAQNTTPTVATNAANLAVSRSNAGANAALQKTAPIEAQSSPDATSNTQTPATTGGAPTQSATANEATTSKSNNVEVVQKVASQGQEPVSTTLDGAGSTAVIGGQEVATPANDQASRAPQLTPHTIPMLAATMMRRFESGSKQFTMRLDPPELGQVEVKLTVGVDKKVRAVVSADRPEALADLVRSARELARALADAGLDLDDNGLTFQLNDPSSGGQQRGARDPQTAQHATTSSAQVRNGEAEVQTPLDKVKTANDPFQRWQRARIALTA